MKRFAAMMLAALLAASSTTVAFAAKNYDYIGFGGWVTLDYDAMDGGNVLVPGNTYTFPILDGSDYFNEESSEIWSITAAEYVPDDGDEKFSSVSVDKGADGNYYLTVKVKQNRETYYSEQEAYVLLKIKEKGLSSEDKEINSSMADELEANTYAFSAAAGLDAGTDVTLRNLQKYSAESPVDFEYGFIDGLNQSEVDKDVDEKHITKKLQSEDRVTYTTISVEEFEIASTDYDVIDDDEYDVDNSMPLVMAGGDVSKSNLSFGNTAEYLAKFSSSKEKPYNLSYSTVTNSDVAGANPNADLVCISFPGTPMFAANSYLVIKDKDMKYLYEVDGDELIELETTTQDGYLAYRTDRLTSYIASDRPLKNAVSSSDKETSSSSPSSSTSSSTASGGSTSSKPNPDTGR